MLNYDYKELGKGIILTSILLKNMQTISFSKFCLILPLINHSETYNFLKRNDTIIRGIDELILKKPHIVTNFHKRYYSYLSSSLSMLLLMKELNLIDVDTQINYKEDFFLNNDTAFLVELYDELQPIVEKINILFNQKSSYLYLNLRVIL